MTEFRRFLQIIEESRLQWQKQQLMLEAQRLQRELDKSAQDRLSDFETKLLHARRL